MFLPNMLHKLEIGRPRLRCRKGVGVVALVVGLLSAALFTQVHAQSQYRDGHNVVAGVVAGLVVGAILSDHGDYKKHDRRHAHHRQHSYQVHRYHYNGHRHKRYRKQHKRYNHCCKQHHKHYKQHNRHRAYHHSSRQYEQPVRYKGGVKVVNHNHF